MIPVARDQQKGVIVAIGVTALDGDLSPIVDLIRLIDLQAGAGRHQSVEIHRRAAILPQERNIPIADDLIGGVDRSGYGVNSEAGLPPLSSNLPPKEGVKVKICKKICVDRRASHDSVLVDR
jgi:hypothetical protein